MTFLFGTNFVVCAFFKCAHFLDMMLMALLLHNAQASNKTGRFPPPTHSQKTERQKTLWGHEHLLRIKKGLKYFRLIYGGLHT